MAAGDTSVGLLGPVIVDAIGVTKSVKTYSQPFITKPTVPLKDLATGVMMCARDEDTVSSLTGRLARLNNQLDNRDQERINEAADGASLSEIVRDLFDAINGDRIEEFAMKAAGGTEPTGQYQARDDVIRWLFA